MKKRVLSLSLAFVLLASLLAGCGSGQTTPPSTSNPASSTQSNQPGSPGNQPQYMVWNMGAEPKTWDPTLSSETISEYITISMFEA